MAIQVTHFLTHWGRVTHICVGKLTIIGSNNGLSPGRRQAIIWTNAATLLIGPLRTNFSEILSEIHSFSFKKMHLKMSSGKWRPACLGLNVLIRNSCVRCDPSLLCVMECVVHLQCGSWDWSHQRAIILSASEAHHKVKYHEMYFIYNTSIPQVKPFRTFVHSCTKFQNDFDNWEISYVIGKRDLRLRLISRGYSSSQRSPVLYILW